MASEACRGVSSSAISISELSTIARNRGLELKAKRLTWAELAKAASACQTLLVLRNRNVVAVLQNRCEQQGHIVVSDPLYRNGDAFFLPSIALERVWDGRALS